MEENSWSYARRFHHKRLRMIQESSIIIQDMIWENRNHTNEFWLWERFIMLLQRIFCLYKVKRTFSLDVSRINKHITIIILLSTNVFCEKCFLENVLSKWREILENVLGKQNHQRKISKMFLVIKAYEIIIWHQHIENVLRKKNQQRNISKVVSCDKSIWHHHITSRWYQPVLTSDQQASTSRVQLMTSCKTCCSMPKLRLKQ